jgi:hypothetical protein
MDLNIGTIMVGIFCVALCVIPFLLLGRSHKKNEHLKLKSFITAANLHDAQITSHQFCGKVGIAIDDKKGFVFFNKELKDQSLEETIDLDQIQECKLNIASVTVKRNNENDKIIERLELCFVPHSKNDKEVKWEIFNRETNLSLSGELQFGEKWSKLINEQIHVKV